jgi:medium-chain acyl-[acyl-carrier-protein] hydrolase
MQTPGGWFVCAEPSARARVRLYVFPHAGAGPAALGDLAGALPDTIELWALNLPGRQARLDEAPRTDLEPLVAEIAADVIAAPGRYALFGYCGGALLAYLVARQSAPVRLIVGSFAAPDLALLPRRLHRLPDVSFWDVVLDQGGVPPDLARRADLRPVFERVLRADFALYAGYRHRHQPPLTMPITVLHGRDDTELTRGELLGWRRHTTSRPDQWDLDGGHWLVDEHPAEVAAGLAQRIDASLRALGPQP